MFAEGVDATSEQHCCKKITSPPQATWLQLHQQASACPAAEQLFRCLQSQRAKLPRLSNFDLNFEL